MVSEANTHPFEAGGAKFTHFSQFEDIAAVEALIDPDLPHLVRGDTDSERYCHAVVLAGQVRRCRRRRALGVVVMVMVMVMVELHPLPD